MKAINIQWDTDGEDIKELNLPTEVEIPDYLLDGYDGTNIETYCQDISDWLSDKYGFCHFGFEVADQLEKGGKYYAEIQKISRPNG